MTDKPWKVVPIEAGRNWIDHGYYIELFPPEEFSFTETLGYLSRSSNECMYSVENNSLLKLIPCGTGHRLVNISGNGRTKQEESCHEEDRDIRAHESSIIITFADSSKLTNEQERAAVAAYVWDWFDLGADLRPFYEMARQDTLLAGAVNRYYGLRIIGIPDLFEALCWGIMGQQINLTFAYTLKRRFVEAFGQAIYIPRGQDRISAPHQLWRQDKHLSVTALYQPGEQHSHQSVSAPHQPGEQGNQAYWIFPVPETIAVLTVNDLTPLQLTVKKSEYLIGVAKLMTEGALTKKQLLDLPDMDAAEKELTSIRGIGPWTANYVLMRCLRSPSAFPIEDAGLHNAFKHLLQLDKKPSIDHLRRLSEHWGIWKPYATFYLWRILY